MDASTAAGQVAPVLYCQVSASAWQKLKSNSCSCSSSSSPGLPPDMGFMICNTIRLFVWTISLCKLDDSNLIASSWGQCWFKGRWFHINENGIKVLVLSLCWFAKSTLRGQCGDSSDEVKYFLKPFFTSQMKP